MKDAYEVLRRKENEVSKLKREVEALRIAAPLVSGNDQAINQSILERDTVAEHYSPTAYTSKPISENELRVELRKAGMPDAKINAHIEHAASRLAGR
jgi:hypothetical protein